MYERSIGFLLRYDFFFFFLLELLAIRREEEEEEKEEAGHNKYKIQNVDK